MHAGVFLQETCIASRQREKKKKKSKQPVNKSRDSYTTRERGAQALIVHSFNSDKLNGKLEYEETNSILCTYKVEW